MNPVLPRLALHSLRRDAHPILVSTRRGRVLHLVDAGCCHPGDSFTPGGRLRKRLRPMCGQRGSSWYFQDLPTRTLCAYCTAIATKVERPTDWRRLDVVDVLHAIGLATNSDGIHAARRALLESNQLTDPALRQVLNDRAAVLDPHLSTGSDFAWADAIPFDGSWRHPHPPVRHSFAA